MKKKKVVKKCANYIRHGAYGYFKISLTCWHHKEAAMLPEKKASIEQ